MIWDTERSTSGSTRGASDPADTGVYADGNSRSLEVSVALMEETEFWMMLARA